MSDDNKNSNVIQFPGRKKEAEPKAEIPAQTPSADAAAPQAPAAPKRAAKRKAAKASKKTLAGTVLAVILATGAVNRYVFDNQAHLRSTTFTSYDGVAASNPNVKRGLASVEKTWTRDAQWEK